MRHQLSFADSEYQHKRRQARKEKFLERMDATIIAAPSSNKNKAGERDPEMQQTKKGNQWHFDMEDHIGVDARTGLTHSLTTSATNEHDLNQAENLLHGDEEFIFVDAGYRGAEKRDS